MGRQRTTAGLAQGNDNPVPGSRQQLNGCNMDRAKPRVHHATGQQRNRADLLPLRQMDGASQAGGGTGSISHSSQAGFERIRQEPDDPRPLREP